MLSAFQVRGVDSYCLKMISRSLLFAARLYEQFLVLLHSFVVLVIVIRRRRKMRV